MLYSPSTGTRKQQQTIFVGGGGGGGGQQQQQQQQQQGLQHPVLLKRILKILLFNFLDNYLESKTVYVISVYYVKI